MKNTIHNKISILVPWVIACALFMETLDTTIISTAIPTMAHFFGISPISLKLAITSYLMSLAIFVPISGWIAEKYGVKNVFICAFVVFTISSMLCGLSGNIWELVLFRVLQGLGGAIMMPVGRLILLKLYPKSELIKVTNYATIPSLFGPMVGPLAGGFITSYISWRWIFLVNVPFGIAGAILASTVIPHMQHKKVKHFDVVGFILFSCGLLGISFIISTVNEHVFSLPFRLLIVLLSMLSLLGYILSYKHSKNPVWNLDIFKIRTFRVTVLGSLFTRIGIGGIPFLLPLLFQVGLGYSPIISGMLIFPMAIAMFATKFFVKAILKQFGFKKVLTINTLLMGIVICSFAGINIHTGYYVIAALVFLNGIFSSMQFSCMNVLAYVDLDEHILSQGTSIASSIQQLAMGFGVAFSAICLKLFLFDSVSNIKSFSNSFLVVGLFTIISTYIFGRLKSFDGNLVSDRR